MTGIIGRIVRSVRRTPVVGVATRWAVKLVPDLRWTVQVTGLGPLRVRLRRNKEYWIRPLLDDQDVALGILASLVRSGDVVYDVGANIGVYARIFVQWFGASEVLAFEPMRDNVELLEANARLLSAPGRITVLPVALGDRDGEEPLQIDDVFSGTAVLDRVSGGEASVGRRRRGLPPKTETVTVRRLDGLLESGAPPGPDVLKVDTEGAGALVLQGAAATLDRFGPRVTVSVHGPEETRGVLDVLAPLGYRCYGVPKGGLGAYGPVTSSDFALLPAKGNLVCSRHECDLRIHVAPLRAMPERARRA